MTTRGQSFYFHISCERTALSECSTFKGEQLEAVPSAGRGICTFPHPGPCGFASCFALAAGIALPAEGKLQFMIWLRTQGWTLCLQWVELRKRMAGQGDKGTVGGAAFGTNTALNGLMLKMKPCPWTCNILCNFGRPYYFDILTKLAVGSMGSLNGSYPSSLGYLR